MFMYLAFLPRAIYIHDLRMTSYHHIIISCRMNTKMETNQLHVKSCAHVGSESSDGDLRFQSQPVSQAAVFETLFTNLSLMGSFPHDQIKITHAQNSNNMHIHKIS